MKSSEFPCLRVVRPNEDYAVDFFLCVAVDRQLITNREKKNEMPVVSIVAKILA